MTDSAGGRRVSDKALMGFWLPFIPISKLKESTIAKKKKKSRNLNHVLDCWHILQIVSKIVLVDKGFIFSAIVSKRFYENNSFPF